MQIRCADCGCLPSECKVALRRANVPIVHRENIAAAGILQRIASFSEAEALGGMDKKAKKRIDLLRRKLTDLQQRLAGAKQQMDDPSEVRLLEKDIAAAQQEIEKLKAS